MMRRAFLACLLLLAAKDYAFAQTGRGFVDPLSITPSTSYVFTYNMGTGACVRTLAGVVNGSCTSVTPVATGNTAAQNDTATLTLAKQAQYHTRPQVTSWWNPGGYSASSFAGTGNGGDGLQAADASPTNTIVVNWPAGTFLISNNQFMMNVPRWKLVGVGSDLTNATPTVIENTNNNGTQVSEQAVHAGTFDYWSTAYVGSVANAGYFIQSISAGATSATLSGSAANAANYYVGGWILIASYDQQWAGYPPNMRYYDWAKVTSANSGTGVITWDTPTRFAHTGLPSGFTTASVTNPYNPSALTDGPSGSVGPARIIPIDTPAHPVAVYVEIDGIEMAANPNWGLGSQQYNDCPSIAGVIDLVFNDVDMKEGMCVNQARNVTLNNDVWQANEADKTVNTLTLNTERSTFADVSHAAELLYTINGGHISGTNTTFGGNTFQGYQMIVNGAILDAPTQPAAQFQHAVNIDTQFAPSSVIWNGVIVNGIGSTNNGPINAPSRTSAGGGYAQTTVDGTTVVAGSGPNGAGTRLTIPNVLGTSSHQSYIIAQSCAIGAQLYHNGSYVSGSNVTNVSGNTTSIFLDITGFTMATNDTIWCVRVPSVTVTNSVGNNTGYNWTQASPPFRYPNGTSLPVFTVTNSSGN